MEVLLAHVGNVCVFLVDFFTEISKLLYLIEFIHSIAVKKLKLVWALPNTFVTFVSHKRMFGSKQKNIEFQKEQKLSNKIKIRYIFIFKQENLF